MTAEAQPVRHILVETLRRLGGAHRQRAEQALANIGTSSLPRLKRTLRDLAKGEIKQAQRIELALSILGAGTGSEHDRAMAGLVEANNALVARCDARAGRDLANIAAAQSAAHLFIAEYGAARAYAAALGNGRVARLLGKTLAELGATDRALTRLAARVLQAARRPGYPESATAAAPVAASAVLGSLAVGAVSLALLAPPKRRRHGLAALLPRR